MKNLVDKKIEKWLDESDSLKLDPLGKLVIEDKAILEAIAGGTSMHDYDTDKSNLDIDAEEALCFTGTGCSCKGAGCGC